MSCTQATTPYKEFEIMILKSMPYLTGANEFKTWQIY